MDEQNPKFQQIVGTARELFWKHGVKRVTVEEICEKSEVSKMTFYKHFANKADLAKYIMQKLFNEGIKQYRDIMESQTPYIKKVEKIIQMKMDNTNNISQEFLNDMYKSGEPELQQMINKYVQRNMQMIQNDFIEAQKAGHIRKDVNPKFILYILYKFIEMSTDEQLTSMYQNPQEMIREFVNLFYYGVINEHE